MTGSSSSLAGEPRSITLQPYFQRRYTVGIHTGFRIRVEVTDSVNMPLAIFRYFQRPDSPNGEEVAYFGGICTVEDLERYPENAPNLSDSPPTFRLDYLDYVLHSAQQAKELWDIIQADIQQLIDSLDAMDDLEMLAPVVLTGSA